MAAAAVAHSVTREEVLAHLNAPEVRQREAIHRASSPDKLPELLLIEVTENWRTLAADDRRATARRWLSLWHHAVARGRVSVVDESGQPVVHYRPSGDVELSP